MVSKASILLLVVLLLKPLPSLAAVSESDLNEAVQKKNWPEVVLLLSPEQGQNFEHDLTLARAYLFLERRQEALSLALKLYNTRKDEKSRAILDLAGTLFFNQETSNLYYDAIRLISISKFQEARERLDQALAREPNQVLILTRLLQVELLLGLKETAANHLKLAQTYSPFSMQLKLFGAKIALDAEPDDDQDWYKELLPLKASLLENEVTMTLWFRALKQGKKTVELASYAKKMIKEHPSWTSALLWIYQNGSLVDADRAKYLAQINLNLKNKDQFNALLEQEMKQTQYFWIGYIVYETLLQQLK